MSAQDVAVIVYAVAVVIATIIGGWYLAGSPGSREPLGFFERRPRIRTHRLIEKLGREGEKIINMHMVRLINQHRPRDHWNG